MPVVDRTPSSALAIYAHPDDADVSCGGTLARWAAAGATVEVIVVCRGEKGSGGAPEGGEDELAQQREAEVAEAMAALGVSRFHLLGRGDGEVVNDEALRAELVGLMRRLQPEIVVSPDPTAVFFGSSYVNHRDHRQLGWAVLDSVAPAVSSPRYFPAQGPAHSVRELWLSGTLQADAHVDITESLSAKVAAVSCHVSQIGDGLDVVSQVVGQRAAQAGQVAGLAAAESFRRLILG